MSNHAAVNADLSAPGNNLPEVYCLVLRSADDHRYIGVMGIHQLNTVSRRQKDFALRRVDNPAVCNIRSDQVNFPACRCRNGPLVLNGAGKEPGFEVVFPPHEIQIADVQGRCKETVGVDFRTLTNKDAVRIDQKYPSVRLQYAQYL